MRKHDFIKYGIIGFVVLSILNSCLYYAPDNELNMNSKEATTQVETLYETETEINIGETTESVEETINLIEDSVQLDEEPIENPAPKADKQEIPEKQVETASVEPPKSSTPVVTIASIPEYSGKPYVLVNNSNPYFTEGDYTTNSFETYTPLDAMGRCGTAYANIGIDIMPTEERGPIGSVKPTGWQTVKYDFVDGKYLYNRCHLIGYQLSAENANIKNLITGTRYLNIQGMLPFENMVADYIKETKNHVLYRVTPVFEGNNLLASGVLMEALSVEDRGAGIKFCVFCYNVQPDVVINYSNGLSESAKPAEKKETAVAGSNSKNSTSNNISSTKTQSSNTSSSTKVQSSGTASEKNTDISSPNQNLTSYIANKNTKKFHYPYCHSVDKMKESNKKYINSTHDGMVASGYSPCKNCNP